MATLGTALQLLGYSLAIPIFAVVIGWLVREGKKDWQLRDSLIWKLALVLFGLGVILAVYRVGFLLGVTTFDPWALLMNALSDWLWRSIRS